MVLQDNVVCVDGTGYQNVHVVANLERLPFQDESLAGLLNLAVLEHARRPETQVAEMRRVLKPGGRALCFVPFIQGFHASPYDYQRYTKSGLSELFREFEILDLRVGSGPTSGLLWIAQEWLAMVLSLGSMRLYRVLLPLTWILSPLKYLDVLLMRHPAATAIASGHFIEVRKPAPECIQQRARDGAGNRSLRHGRIVARGRWLTSCVNIEGRAAFFAAADLVSMNDLPVERPQS